MVLMVLMVSGCLQFGLEVRYGHKIGQERGNEGCLFMARW
jgi:hypothetical protein